MSLNLHMVENALQTASCSGYEVVKDICKDLYFY